MTAANTTESFWLKVEKTDECWLWRGEVIHCGYGRFWFKQQRILAHRFAYESSVGIIPAGLELDHLCRVRACVRPDHLEPVTRQENLRRQVASRTECRNGHPISETQVMPSGHRRCRLCLIESGRLRAVPRDPERCKQGHLYDDANTYIPKNGRRACRACQRAWQRSYQERKKAAAA